MSAEGGRMAAGKHTYDRVCIYTWLHGCMAVLHGYVHVCVIVDH